MKITILTAGTEGDVRPFLALAVGLKEAGFSVTLATGTNFASLIKRYGISYFPMRVDYHELIASGQGRGLLSRNLYRFIRAAGKLFLPLARQVLEDSWEACRDTDAIIYHPMVMGAPHIAEKLQKPIMIACPLPLLSPTRDFPIPVFVRHSWGAFPNKISFSIAHLLAKPFHGMINEWRQRVLGLPKRSLFESDLALYGRPIPILYFYSPHMIPKPFDWGERVQVTGYWFLNEKAEWQPPADLVAFLKRGTIPVYVGFGSMAAEGAEKVSKVVIEAVRKAKARAVVTTGWGGLADFRPSDDVFMVRAVPHEWLFPQVSAVVCHGGAGTIASALRAGRPAVVCPVSFDQPFWGGVVQGLGVGLRSRPLYRLGVDDLAWAIREAMTNDGMRSRAEELGQKITMEDGIEVAVRTVKRWILPAAALKNKTETSAGRPLIVE